MTLPDRFQAFRIHRGDDGGVAARLEQVGSSSLGDAAVLVKVEYSSINYKDALAATGNGAIVRNFPLIGGIDLAGTVVESTHPDWRPGDAVLVCGEGLGETENGGYAEYAAVKPESLARIPSSLDARTVMILGTAGLTAALAVDALETHGVAADSGPVLVTGATGGVGSVAIQMLSTRGYEVVALTGKADASDYLRGLGAGEILDRGSIESTKRPLESAVFAGAVDGLGGEPLAWLLKRIKPNGAVAAIGLAASASLNTTVLPFILRGVSLIGINSVVLDPVRRERIWQRIAGDLRLPDFDAIVAREVTLEELPNAFQEFIDAKATGRTLVRVGRS